MGNPIQEFQAKNGLTADGVIGKKTLMKMMEVFHKTKEEISNFMGQGKVESMDYTRNRENLNYSAQRLLDIFPRYFKSMAQAKEYEYKPEKIANYVYDDKNRSVNGKLGNTVFGWGWLYRGNGGIQTTGHDNHLAFSKYVNDPEIMKNPDLLWQKYYFEAMLFYFDNKKLWKHCKEVTTKSMTNLTLGVNGGTHGLDKRMEATRKYYAMLA